MVRPWGLLIWFACWSPLAFGDTSATETNSLLVSFGPTVARETIDALVTHTPPEYGQLPFPSLAQFPPIAVRRAVQPQEGDQAARVLATPDSLEARLERIVQMDFSTPQARASAHAGLAADPLVASVSVVVEQSANDEGSGTVLPPSGQAGLLNQQPHLALLGIDGDYLSLGGWSLVGVLDNGLDPNHPELRSFNGSTWVPGGPYLPAVSRNVSGNGSMASNLDEVQAYPATEAAAPCDFDLDGFIEYDFAGHGTHVSGLIAANSQGATPLRGTCSNCSLAIAKRSYLTCAATPQGHKVKPTNSDPIDIAGYTYLVEVGSQVLNFSFGSTKNRCEADPALPVCVPLALAAMRDVLMVATAGNDKDTLNFPARDTRVLSIGGIDASGAFWDSNPGSGASCPFCGSNYPDNVIHTYEKQDLVAPALDIRSTFYPGYAWSPGASCGDGYPASDLLSVDGSGWCSGTSMSAPMVSGILGGLRALNPLARGGDPRDGVDDGIVDALVQTASQAAAPQHKTGFGVPDSKAAAARVLGKVGGTAVANRVTVLFGLYSAKGVDHAAVASPQMAMSLLLNATNAYGSTGDAIAGYPTFPATTGANVPQARALILTTGRKPRSQWPAPEPIFLLEKERQGAVACDFNNWNCYGDLVTVPATLVPAAVAAGYQFRGQQGFVYSPCTPEPSCMPPGTQRLLLKCGMFVVSGKQFSDCAVFLEKDSANFVGHTELFAQASSATIGYAYPATDQDKDQLPDGIEYVIGTLPTDPDSDGDSMSDGTEFPLASLAVSDPCAGPAGCNENRVFRNGFEVSP